MGMREFARFVSGDRYADRTMISVHVDHDEKNLWAALAARRGISLARFVRESVRERLAQDGLAAPSPELRTPELQAPEPGQRC